MILTEITPEELVQKIRTVVREEMQARFDRPITRREVADLMGVSLTTVNKWIRKGDIIRINPGSGHPRFSMNEILNRRKV